MSSIPNTVIQSLAAHLLSGQSALHSWSLDCVDTVRNGPKLGPKLIASAIALSHIFTINARFLENEHGGLEFLYTFTVKFNGIAGDGNGGSLSITSKMDVFESAKLANGPSWESVILKSIEVLERRAFHLSDDLKAIQPRKQIHPRKQIRSSGEKA